MDAPVVSIKIKGLGATALKSKGAVIGGLKLKGLALGKGAAVKAAEFEAKRVTATKGGLLLHVSEMEGHTHALVKGGTVSSKAAVAKSFAAKSAVGGKSAAGTAAMSAKGFGWSLGLGGLGPWLVLGSLGLAAAGIYMYLRAQQQQQIAQEQDEFEAPA